jgi:hypothetical protein
MQLFVVGHDCGHRSFSENKLVEDIVGTLMFMPLIYPFEPWRIKHNQHHAFTNQCVPPFSEISKHGCYHPFHTARVLHMSGIIMAKASSSSPEGRCYMRLLVLYEAVSAIKFLPPPLPRPVPHLPTGRALSTSIAVWEPKQLEAICFGNGFGGGGGRGRSAASLV